MLTALRLSFNTLYHRLLRERQPLYLALVAVLVGSLVGLAAVAFIKLISLLQQGFYGIDTEYLASHIRTELEDGLSQGLSGGVFGGLPSWLLLLVPSLGGLLVGILTYVNMPERRPYGIADVIEANALRGGHLSSAVGWRAAFLAALSIGSGASVGREGPIVHFGASIGSLVARKLHLARHHARTLLSCGVAAAIAASFNAPLAGVFFALEVVIGHYGFAAMAPIVLSAITATGVSRLLLGNDTAFVIPAQSIVNPWEAPAFLLLGGAGGVTALVFIFATRWVKRGFERLPVPLWLRPAIAGFLIGLMALYAPEILGVSYEGTSAALVGQVGFSFAVLLLGAKLLASALALGSGFSGGVFSPALFVGAMLGTCFGYTAVAAAGVPASEVSVYSIVGMAAVAAPVMGSPISSILMVFELTGEYSLLLAVMGAVVVAMFVTHVADIHSFFTVQLEARGIFIKDGHDVSVLQRLTVADVMDTHIARLEPSAQSAEMKAALLASRWGKVVVVDSLDRLLGVVSLVLDRARLDEAHVTAGELAHDGPVLTPEQSLVDAIRMLRNSGEAHIPVIQSHDQRYVVGQVHEHDLNHAYHQALIQHEGFEDLERLYNTESRPASGRLP